LIEPICRVSASPDFIADIRTDRGSYSLVAALAENDTPAIFDWMIGAFSYQGISDSVADTYLERHGNATWHQIGDLLTRQPSCPRLLNYWTYENCRYEKQSERCAEPEHFGCCPVPSHHLRNGRLNQTAYSLYFFVRDIMAGDVGGWIDNQIASVEKSSSNYHQLIQDALIEPMRHIFGVSDKILSMALSSILMAAPDNRPHWFKAGSQMIVVDTLIHNVLHRTGILHRYNASHAYGPACYRPGHCAELLRQVSAGIDARQFDPSYPANFPRFIQNALWRYCAGSGLNICNGNTIDDRKYCENDECIIFDKCSKMLIKSQ
jgi:hypothetical protein